MEKKIIEYDVVLFKSREDLVSAVEAAIANGWQPLGSISVSVYAIGLSGAFYSFAQAMVKYEYVDVNSGKESYFDDIGVTHDVQLALEVSRKLAEMNMTGKMVSLKQVRYVRDCIVQGKNVILADLMSIK